MKKKVLFAVILMMVTAFPKSAWGYSFSKVISTGDTLYFTILSYDNHTVEAVHPSYSDVPNYNGYAKPTGTLTIPSTVEMGGISYTVVSIGTYAYYGCTGITSVSIPPTVTHIKQAAFNQCTSLTSVTIASGLETIGSYAFAYCSSLENIGIPSTVDSIAPHAFEYSGLTSFSFPAGMTNVPYSMFSHCGSLTEVTLPNSLTAISGYAFQYCVSLEHIEIPSQVTTIEDYAFYNCQSLDSVLLPSGLTGLGNAAFGYCYGLSSIAIPSGITTIPNYCFSGCSNLATASLHNGMTSIGAEAFAGCTALNAELPNSITSIGNSAFSHCTSLTSMELPEGITSLGQYAFQYSGLQTLTIPSVCTSLNLAFTGCHIGKVFFNATNMADGSVYSGVFSGCAVDTLVIGANVNRVPSFAGTSSLTDVVFIGSDTKLANGAFGSCDQLSSVSLPSLLDTIPNNAFSYTGSLQSISLPTTITCIGNSAFYMSGLEEAVIPEGVLYVGENVFNGCELSRIEVPSSVVSIGNSAFAGIDTVSMLGSTPPNVPQTFFYSWHGGIINVPCGTGSSYRTAWTWAHDNIVDTCEIHHTLTLVNHGGGYFTYLDDNYDQQFIVDTTIMEFLDTMNRTLLFVSFVNDSYANGFTPQVIRVSVNGAEVNLSDITSFDQGQYVMYQYVITTDTTTVIEVWFGNLETPETYSITFLSSDETLGEVEGYYDGETATAYGWAYAFGGSIFNGWSNGSMENPLTITVTSDTTLTALFSVGGTATNDTILIHDTTYITLTDTVTNTILDTITNTVYDTIDNFIYDTLTVTDTLWLTHYDTIWLHDTIYIHDTVVVGVGDVETVRTKIYSNYGQIVVEGAEGNTVTFYDMAGRLLATKRDDYTLLRFDVPASGTYLVKVGNAPARRIVVVR